MDKIMDEIKRIIKDEHQRGYKEGYEHGYEYGYKEGYVYGEFDCRKEKAEYTAEKLYDALRFIWDNTEDGGMPVNDVVSVFGTCNLYAIFHLHSAKEIIDKIEAYKEKKEQEEEEIRVGDVLKAIPEIDEGDALEYIVTYIDADHKHYDCICPDGAVYHDVNIQAMAKTGKHYKIYFREDGENVAVSI